MSQNKTTFKSTVPKIIFSIFVISSFSIVGIGVTQIVDDFEDNDLKEYVIQQDSGTAGTQTSIVNNGTYALEIVATNGNTHSISSTEGLNAYPGFGDVMEVWVRTDNWAFIRLEDPNLQVGLVEENDEFRILGGESDTVTIQEDIWYKIEITFGTTATAKLYSQDGTLLSEVTREYSGFDWLQYLEFGGANKGEGTSNTYFDDLKIIGQAEGFSTVNIETIDGNDDQLSNVSIEIYNSSTGNLIETVETNSTGKLMFTLPNGEYNMVASKGGYESVTKNNVSIIEETTLEFQLTATNFLTLEVDGYFNQGETKPYKVKFTNSSISEYVTEGANITIQNQSVLSLNENDNTLTGLSVNQTTEVTASYQNNYTDSKTVVVSVRTLDNIGIMPGHVWLTSFFGIDSADNGLGSEIQWLFVTIFLMMVSAYLTRNAFVGIGVGILSSILFWVSTWISFGIMLSIVFFGIFLALNLIDTQNETRR